MSSWILRIRSLGDESILVVFCLCFLPFLVVDSNLRAQQSAGEEERYERLVRRGKEAEATRDWNQAVGSFEEALRLRPKSISLQTKVAALYFDRKNYEKTLDHCTRALASDPENGDAAKLAGMAAYRLNKFDVARRYLEKAIAVRRNDAELHYWLGMTLYAAHDARHALDELYRARAYNGKDTEVLYMIGKIHWEMSRQAWEEMLRVDPNSFRVKEMVAENDVSANLFPEAIEKYQTIIRQKPDAQGVHDALGKLYLHVGKLTEAEDAFRTELKLNPHSSTSYYGLADIAFQRQDLAAALENVTRAIQEKPDFGDAYGLLGRVDWHLGDKQKAVEMLEHATSLAPSNASLYYMLGHYYEALGKRALAAKAIRTYNDLKSEQEKEYDAGRP